MPRPYGTIFAFLLPALTLYVAFTAYPFFRTLWNSFHKVLPRRSEFVGLENYAALANDEFFWRAVRNTLIWASTSPLFEVSIALLLALALYAKVPGARFFRVAWFTPVLMSYVVVGILWRVDLQLRLGAGERRAALRSASATSPAPGSATRTPRFPR